MHSLSIRSAKNFRSSGRSLSSALKMPVDAMWTMRNGYALCTRAGLARLAEAAVRPLDRRECPVQLFDFRDMERAIEAARELIFQSLA